MDGAVTELARAKINLTLHVGPLNKSGTGQGYHPLHSLVVFADIGDKLAAKKAETWGLTIEGPYANGVPSDDSNLVLKAAKHIAKNRSVTTPLHFHLTKILPVASGIGGGSADAAAAIRVLGRSFAQVPADDIVTLGADIPVCLKSETCFMQGIGEQLTPLPGLGRIHAVLVNPGVPVSTGAIFKAFDSRPAPELSGVAPADDLLKMAQSGRNDLQNFAIELCPDIQTVLEELGATADCQLARMSGSGASCFGLYPNADAAKTAAQAIQAVHPKWWCTATILGDIT